MANAKYIQWDATNKRYKEISGLPIGVSTDDERILEYDHGTGLWVVGRRIVTSPSAPTGTIIDGDIWFDTDAPVPAALGFFAQAEARSDSDVGFPLLGFTANVVTDLSGGTNVTNTTMSYTNTTSATQQPVFAATYSCTATVNGTQKFGAAQEIYINGVLLVSDGTEGTLNQAGDITEKGSYTYPGATIAPGATINVTTKVKYLMTGSAAGSTGVKAFSSAVRMWGGGVAS